ncbi:MAG: type II secretion system protein GspG [Burkholderiales bacterium]
MGQALCLPRPWRKGDFDLLSFGKDGQPGGTGENADITNN